MPIELPRFIRVLSVVLVGVTLLLIFVGTIVTGTGPHSGDSADVPRMPFDWATVTIIHGVLAAATLVVGIALWILVARIPQAVLARRRVAAFVIVVLAQGLIGSVQSLIGLPEVLVALHLLGAALVWVGVLRVLLDVNPTLFAEKDRVEGFSHDTPEVVRTP